MPETPARGAHYAQQMSLGAQASSCCCGFEARATLHVRQRGNVLDGAHQGDFVTRDLFGTIHGDSVVIRSAYNEEHGDALGFAFSGRVSGDEMTGTLDMGEYLKAQWTAKRRGHEKA